MVRRQIRFAIFLIAPALGGCIAEWLQINDARQLGLTLTEPGPTAVASNAAAGPVAVPVVGAQALGGTLSGRSDYRLFDLGAAAAGDELTVTWAGLPYAAMPYVVVLLDERQELLARSLLSSGGDLRHVMRAAATRLYVGVAPANGGNGGTFSLATHVRQGVAAPAPRPQAVWLCFSGGLNVQVHGRGGVSFDPFDAAALGADYVDQTQVIKNAIVAEMRADYAAYNVGMITSDEGPPPVEPHSVIYFGGSDSTLLGLADNVDQYNANLAQTAIIYTDSFSMYASMKLEPQEFGVMIANVASHELGHLLGLFHTRNPDDVMDTTGSAWDLAGAQEFGSVQLETSVFPTGLENSPLRLAETVGLRPIELAAITTEAAEETAPNESAKPATRALLRRFMNEEMQFSCGTCLDLDGFTDTAPPR